MKLNLRIFRSFKHKTHIVLPAFFYSIPYLLRDLFQLIVKALFQSIAICFLLFYVYIFCDLFLGYIFNKFQPKWLIIYPMDDLAIYFAPLGAILAVLIDRYYREQSRENTLKQKIRSLYSEISFNGNRIRESELCIRWMANPGEPPDVDYAIRCAKRMMNQKDPYFGVAQKLKEELIIFTGSYFWHEMEDYETSLTNSIKSAKKIAGHYLSFQNIPVTESTNDLINNLEEIHGKSKLLQKSLWKMLQDAR